jgi:hypothetical protein
MIFVVLNSIFNSEADNPANGMFWLAHNRRTGEGRVFTHARFARRYARKRSWRRIWIGRVA